MTTTTPALEDVPPFAGYDDEHHPLGGYGALMAAYGTAMGGFIAWRKRTGQDLPVEGLGARDLALTAVATQKLSRLIAKDRVTSTFRAPFTEFQESSGHGEVEEKTRGRGLRRAIGELVVCPYCIGFWVAGGLGAGMVAAPRTTRFLAGVVSAHGAADFLQLAYSAAEKRAS